MKIRIQQYDFTIREPYKIGHMLTEGEAQALNTLRADNIRNNVRKPVLDEVAKLPTGQFLGPKVLKALQDTIAKYDESYQFIVKHEPRQRKGAIESLALELAEARVDEQIRRQELSLSPLERDSLITEVSKMDDIQDEARKRLQVRQSIAKETWENL